jgi:predicted aspartyl protease
MRHVRAAAVFLSILMCPVFSESADVAFDFVADTSLIVVPVTINGHGPYRFLLDTGATSTILSSAVADSLKIPVRRRGRVLTAGGNVKVTIRTMRTLNVGKAHLEDIEIAVGEFDLMKRLNVDGLLGGDYLRKFRVNIDYDGKTMKIEQVQPSSRRF